jgi:hypothetical protein
MSLRSMLFIPLFMVAGACRAGDGVPSGANDCPPLMTERECTDYANTLERLQPGDEREAFLLAHARLMLEREKACSCARHLETLARAIPARPVEATRMRF